MSLTAGFVRAWPFSRRSAKHFDLRRAVVLAASLLLAAPMLAGCGGGGGGYAGNGGAGSQPLDQATLQSTVKALAKDLQLPGAVAIVKTPRGSFSTAYGITSYKGTTPTAYDQKIRVGSVTKSWVGTVILQQAQEGTLALTDPVSKHWPGVPNGDNITIEALLTMRSRLFNYTELLVLDQTLDREPQKVWTQQELLALAFAQPPYPEGFHYSNTNSVLRGLIAQKLDGGKPLADVLRDRLWTPLGLRDTSFPPITSNAIPPPYSRGYMYGTNVQTREPLPPEMVAAARAGTLAPGDQTDANPSWAWAAGAGISTANDLVTIVTAMVEGRLLGPAMQAGRLASVRPIDPAEPASPGFAGHDPVRGITVVVWANSAPAADGRAPATTIAAALIGALYAPSGGSAR